MHEIQTNVCSECGMIYVALPTGEKCLSCKLGNGISKKWFKEIKHDQMEKS